MKPGKWEIARDKYHLFDLYLKNESARLDFKARVQTRFWDTGNSSDLSSMAGIFNYEIIPWEIWAQVNDLPLKNFSLKIGKQYFEWGTADGLHPTSVLNPDDYTDPFAMNEKIPVNAVNLNYFISSFKVFLIWLPSFTPVKLPKYFPFLDHTSYQLPGIELVQIQENTTIPKEQSQGMGWAFKCLFTLLSIDLSCGYFQGYDYMPSIKSVNYTLTGNMLDQFNLDIEMSFPKMKVYTMDLATSLHGFGLWTEVGIYDHDKTTLLINSPLRTEVTGILGGPYASYVIGTDYSFSGGFYFNLQYAYGLPYVRGKDYLEDYFILSLKDDFFSGLLEIEIANMLGFNRSRALGKNNEMLLSQHIRSLYFDDIILGIIFSEITAYGNVLFKNWEDYDSLELYISYTF